MTAAASPVASILVVDDTLENLRLLGHMLGAQGYEVRPVTNGRQALQAVEHAPPDLILLDINMPEMNGYEVCQRLKEREAFKDIPVIFLTALTDARDKVRAFEMGGVDYVTKPFQLEEVVARVKTHLALRRAQLELSRNYEHLRALEKLRDDLVHTVVHDMRSPLMVMQWGLEFLQGSAAGLYSEEVSKDVQIIMQAADVLNRMANDLLDVSRLEEAKMPLKREVCDLALLAREVAVSLAGVARARTIQVDTAGPVEAVCDGAIIRRVLENLISNGIKHTPSGSRLRIAITTGDNRVRVAVQDEGPGIPPEAREKIFEKFETIATGHTGPQHSAGLGLAFCRLAVEAHGGTIGVDSGETQGSTFWFELPA